MRMFLLMLAAVCCEARRSDQLARAALHEIGSGSFVLGGTEADVGEFPWQLSQDRQGLLGAWSHSCGASLLSARTALSAAHCVDGASVSILRVVGGVHNRGDQSNAQVSNLQGYTKHEQYNQGSETFNNDIAILSLFAAITEADNVAYARLPENNANQRDGETCVISGWGRTSSSNALPNTLQKAPVTVLSEEVCNLRMSSVSGARVGPGQICVSDEPAQTAGSCNGDSGGPLNCYENNGGGQAVVAGVTSWGIQGGGACLPTYPSVYTRTSNFLAWIADNQ